MKSILYACLAGMSLLWSGCTLDDPDPTPQTPALQLQVIQDLSITRLQWDRVAVTGFSEYILLHSPQDIPNTPEPEVNQDVSVLTRFDDINVTSFSSVNILMTPRTCYKLYTQIGDRFLYSPTVCVDNTVELISGFYDRVTYDEANDDLIIFDRVNTLLSNYDLATQSLTNSVTETLLSFPTLNVSTHQGINSVFAFDQNQSRVRKYSLPFLALANQKHVFDGVSGGLAVGPFVYLATTNSSSSFQVLDQHTLLVKDSKPGVTGLRQFAVFEGDTTTVLEIWETGTRQYKINNLGKVISQHEFLTGVSQISTQNTCDYNNQYFIGGRFSIIMDREGEVITSLSADVNAFSFFSRFTDDGNKAIVLKQDLATILLEIYDISGLPSATLLESYEVPSASYGDVFIRDNIIYLVGINFNASTTQTFILKIPVAI